MSDTPKKAGPMHAFDILKGTRELLAIPDHWLKGEHAQTDDNRSVDPLDLSAKCWCIDGATYKIEGTAVAALNTDHHVIATRLMDRAVKDLFPERGVGDCSTFVNFNDHEETTHPDVLKMLDHAIELAEAN